jgi:hypothetical protein
MPMPSAFSKAPELPPVLIGVRVVRVYIISISGKKLNYSFTGMSFFLCFVHMSAKKDERTRKA